MENIGNLSPIVEESESTLCCEEPSVSTVGASKRCDCKTIRPMCNDCRRISRGAKGDRNTHVERFRVGDNSTYGLDASRCKKSHSTGDNSSADERTERDYYWLGRFKGDYCCPVTQGVPLTKAEASGDNDEARTGRRDKSSRTTVEQLKCRLSQVERKIVALKRYQNPRKCQSHERCEILRKDLQAWRVDHEKRMNARVVKWQLAERQRTYDEMEKTRNVYDNIQRHLETLERRNARSYLNFQRQIDAWEKRLKNEIVTLHEDNLMEFREQLRTWLEMQNAINSPSNVRQERYGAYKLGDDTTAEKQCESDTSNKSQMTMLYQDNAEFLHRIESIIKFEVQQQCDDVVKRMDRKIAELRSAFEDFKHNFRLDRHYLGQDYDEINDRTEETATEEASDFTCRGSAKSDLNTDSEERRTWQAGPTGAAARRHGGAQFPTINGDGCYWRLFGVNTRRNGSLSGSALLVVEDRSV